MTEFAYLREIGARLFLVNFAATAGRTKDANVCQYPLTDTRVDLRQTIRISSTSCAAMSPAPKSSFF